MLLFLLLLMYLNFKCKLEKEKKDIYTLGSVIFRKLFLNLQKRLYSCTKVKKEAC